jgi:hypothetical protein
MSMQKPRWPVEGGCRCGRVRFRLTGPPLIEMACHCRGCQRMSASAFSTTLIMASAHFALLQGETEVGGIHGDQVHHHHCPWCKGWVYTKAVAAPDSINVRATLLDDPSWFAPWAETQTRGSRMPARSDRCWRTTRPSAADVGGRSAAGV